MHASTTKLPEVLLIEPTCQHDTRGFFLETWHQERYLALGLPPLMAQDNLSWSRRHVLRGLHFQHPAAQAKLVQVLVGEIFDVAVDVRRGSPTFGSWTVCNYRPRTIISSIFPKALPTDSLWYPTVRWLPTNAPPPTIRLVNGELPGMIRPWQFPGPQLNRSYRTRMVNCRGCATYLAISFPTISRSASR